MFFSHHSPNTGREECMYKSGVTLDDCHDYATSDTSPTAMAWYN
jgi:hypothetical protein